MKNNYHDAINLHNQKLKIIPLGGLGEIGKNMTVIRYEDEILLIDSVAAIAGGMGGGAVEIFNERNIEVVVGASGDARMAVESYLRGDLHSTGSVCHEHAHADECGH